MHLGEGIFSVVFTVPKLSLPYCLDNDTGIYTATYR